MRRLLRLFSRRRPRPAAAGPVVRLSGAMPPGPIVLVIPESLYRKAVGR